ncbi:hypothetical protein FALBO_11136 [Fusarium albosuccineum]|uniref:Uncharacterized protein n=1 Tax=Fusarium albosuccineum TaxID=1237068 RepID=A0A8H4P7G1_9HYPO|nr:hypothetical protein FALBO_11136 [Fusarium albosuccineum]
MHFARIAHALAALAMAHQANGWKIHAYESYGCSVDKNTFYRTIQGAVDGCYTYGQEMPGTTCEQFEPGSSTTVNCTGDHWADSILADAGTSCLFYYEGYCQGKQRIFQTEGKAECFDTQGLSSISSFICWDQDSIE